LEKKKADVDELRAAWAGPGSHGPWALAPKEYTCKSMVVASSNYFRANLGSLDESLLERLERWSRAQFAAHSLSRSPVGDTVLYASCPCGKTKKSFGMAIRTVFKNWRAPLELRDEWLEMISHADYEVGAGAPEAARIKDEPWQPNVARTPVSDTTPAVSTEFEGAVKTRLSEGFDMRAGAMWRQLQTISCA
jgi:hypothetical protein